MVLTEVFVIDSCMSLCPITYLLKKETMPRKWDKNINADKIASRVDEILANIKVAVSLDFAPVLA